MNHAGQDRKASRSMAPARHRSRLPGVLPSWSASMRTLSAFWTATALRATSGDASSSQGWVQRIARSIRIFHLACRSTREATHIGRALCELSKCARAEFGLASAWMAPDSPGREDFADCLEGLDDMWRRLAQGEVATAEELIHVTDSLIVQLIHHLP